MGTSLVIGGGGFIGSNLVRYLARLGERCIVVDNGTSLGGLRPLPKPVEFFNSHVRDFRLKKRTRVDSVFYLAARVGDITYNSRNQSFMLEANLDALSGLRYVYEIRPKSVVYFSTACVYPSDSPVPTTEEWGQKGLPEPTNLGYGVAKRTGEILASVLHRETGINTVIVRPFNAYGPWDYFGARSSHFIPAVIYQMLRPRKVVPIFGGSQSRAFVYVEDIVRCAWKLANVAVGIVSVNVGHSQTITIGEATKEIARVAGFRGKVQSVKGPIGYPQRAADSSLLEQLIGPTNWTTFREGIEKTVMWYRKMEPP